MFPINNPAQLSTASTFCATYTSSINTATTGFPSRAAAACGSSPSRFSSVCLCQPKATTSTSSPISPTSSPTSPTSSLTSSTTSLTSSTTSLTSPTTSLTSPTTTVPTSSTTSTTSSTTTTTAATAPCVLTGLLQNGGFECGLSPWVASLSTGTNSGTNYRIGSPGHAGQSAFEFHQTSDPGDSHPNYLAHVSQDVSLTTGVPYILSFQVYFDRSSPTLIVAFINDAPKYGVAPNDKSGPGYWNEISFTFTSLQSITNIRFSYTTGASEVVAKIDDVSITPGLYAP